MTKNYDEHHNCCYDGPMTTAPSRAEITHERIVDVAARVLRRNGFAGVGVADVMKQAGLTHGGFYAHFESREALLAEAVERAGRESGARMRERVDASLARGESGLRTVIESYLSEAHLTGAESGCVVAALSSEMPRQSATVAAPAVNRVRKLIALVQHAMPGGSKEQAMVVASTLVGTLQLARALGANAQGKAVLAASRDALIAQYVTE
jgi:TetR/AcrR family transcriptional repressor of nem operon